MEFSSSYQEKTNFINHDISLLLILALQVSPVRLRVQISVWSICQYHKEPQDNIRSIMETVAANTKVESGSEETVNRVYCLKGVTLNTQLNIKVKVVRLINAVDVEKAKAALESVTDCSLYGLYKGTLCNPSLLRLATLDKADTVGSRISLPADHSPDGNCKRDGSSRPRTQPAPKDIGSSKPSTSKTTEKTELPISTKPSVSASKPSKSSSQGSKAKSQNNQPKLFFNQSSSSANKKLSNESLDKVTSSDKSANRVKEEPLDVTDKKGSPEKSSDKENDSEKTQPKQKRSRVQMFSSSSESEEEPEVNQQHKKTKAKKSTQDSNLKEKRLVNKTGLVLDPDDIQNESDDEDRSEANPKPKRVSDTQTEGKPKRRKRNKEEEVERDSQSEDAKSSKQKHSFGSVKAGEACRSMKYVDKTSIDEEGFLVTEKVLEEVESTVAPPTHSEAPSKPKPPNKKAETAKKSKPVPKHQSSILQFFKTK